MGYKHSKINHFIDKKYIRVQHVTYSTIVQYAFWMDKLNCAITGEQQSTSSNIQYYDM